MSILCIFLLCILLHEKRKPLETTAFQGAASCRSGGIRTRGLLVPNRPLRGPGSLDFTAFEAFSRHWELMSCHSFLLMKMQLSIDFHTTLAQLSNDIAITSERLHINFQSTSNSICKQMYHTIRMTDEGNAWCIM